MNRSPSKNKLILFVVTASLALLGLALLIQFKERLRDFLAAQMGGLASRADTVVDVLFLVLLGILAYLLVRALNNSSSALSFGEGV